MTSKFTTKIIKQTPSHTYFKVYANGGLCGDLVMRNEEFDEFKKLLEVSKWKE